MNKRVPFLIIPLYILAGFLLSSFTTPLSASPLTTQPEKAASTDQATPLPVTATSETIQTQTPEPTKVVYKVVIPIESMDNKIPWLPMDKSEVPGSAYLVFNLESPLVKNKEARIAVAAATDKEKVIEMARKYYEVDPKMATSLTPPQVLGVDLTNIIGINYDPKLAKASLEKAGFNDKTEEPTIKILIWVSGSRQGYRYLLAKEFAKMWETNLGVKTDITTTENPQDVMTKTNWDIYMMIWGADMVDPDNFMGELFTSGKEMNVGKFKSTAYDRLVSEAANAKTPAERQSLYIKAEKMLCEDYVALVPLYSVKNFKR